MSSNPNDNAETIRRRMAALRRELEGDVQQARNSARAMTDWTFYVRRFPWVAAGLALGVGFLLVPRKKQVAPPDSATIAELMKHKEVWQATSTATESRGLVKSIAATLAAMAARAAVAYVTQRVQAAATAAVHNSESPADADAPSTVSEPGAK